MPGNKKHPKPSAERSTQADRSQRNKKRRIEREKNRKKGLGVKSPWYIRAKLGNRLRRLNKKVIHVKPELRGDYNKRIQEIQSLLAA